MAWKIRNGRRYYYISVRDGDRVRSVYVGGSGTLAGLGLLDARPARHGGGLDVEAGAEAATLDVLADRVRGSYGVLALAAAAGLRAAGNHQHNRQWRRSRVTIPQTYFERRSPTGELKALVAKASAGDHEALAAVRAELADRPERFVEVGWGDMAATALSFLTKTIADIQKNGKPDRLHWQAIETKTGMLRADLAGPDPSAVERLLVERCVFTWLELGWLDFLATQAHGDLKRAEKIDRRRTRAHDRHLGSLKALASVRRLPPPPVAIQVNQQVAVMTRPQDAIEAPPNRAGSGGV